MRSGRRRRRCGGRRLGLKAPVAELAARSRRRPPQVVVTCARGSSAHAATFGKHLIERFIGVPVAAAAPNIASVYHRPLLLKDQLFLAVSQSGRSDDLIELARSAKASGALAVAVVNAADSPLAASCDIVLPVAAGPELSVAATKTFVATLAALLRLAAAWTGDTDLDAAIDRLPDRLAAATELDWSAALDALGDAVSMIMIGRGPTLAIAREASLKLKETCNLHAEAFSGAEFRHGPMSLVSTQYPVLMFMPTDAAADGMRTLAADLAPHGHRAVRRRGRSRCGRSAAGARPGPRRDRCRLPDPELLCHGDRPRPSARHQCRSAAPPAEDHPHSMSARRHAVLAGTVFDGEAVHRDCAVVIDGTRIAALAARGEVPAGMPTRTLPDGAWLAPGFIDVQVNGGGDVLFNDEPTPEGIAAIVAGHRKFGTTALLPTLITDTPEKMRAALDAVRRAAPVNPGVLGIHFEGPFLSPGKPGVHDPALIRRPDETDAALLCAPQAHCTVVTLAPEEVPPGFTARLAASGVRVCLGHSMATYAQTKAALCRRARPASRISSMPCGRSNPRAGADRGRARDARRMVRDDRRRRARRAGHAAAGAARRRASDAGDRRDAAGRRTARRASRSMANEIVVRDGRCARADGTLAGAALDMAVRRPQLRAAARRAAHRCSALRVDRAGAVSRPRQGSLAGSRPATAPTWWRSVQVM